MAVQRSIVILWDIREASGRSVSTPWDTRMLTTQSIQAIWGYGIRRRVRVLWTLAAPVQRSVQAIWGMTNHVSRSVSAPWEILDYDFAKRRVRVRWDLLETLPPVFLSNDVLLEAEPNIAIPVGDCTLSADEDSWAWSLTAEIKDIAAWQALVPLVQWQDTAVGIENQYVRLTVRGQQYRFLIDGLERKHDRGRSIFSVRGRSITAVLGAPIARKITKTWPPTTAQTAAGELCTAAGVTLDWQTVDWPLPEGLLTVKDKYPIDVIKMLAEAVGAVVQTTPAGVLTVRPRFRVSPTRYFAVSPDHELSDVEHYTRSSYTYEQRPGNYSIEITNKRVDSDVRVTLSDDDGGRTVRAYVVPFGPVDLFDSAEGNISVVYQGVFQEQLDEEIEIRDGQGRLSSPWYATDSSEWLYADLGALTIDESGDLKAAIAGQSVLQIQYLTQYHQFAITPGSGIELAQVYVEQ